MPYFTPGIVTQMARLGLDRAI